MISQLQYLNHGGFRLYIPSRLGIRTAHSGVAAEILRAAIHMARVLTLLRLASEINALTKLPQLDAAEKENGFNDDNAPFPRDSGVLEDNIVDDGDIEHREGRDETKHDTAKQELVAPDIVHPLREIQL